MFKKQLLPLLFLLPLFAHSQTTWYVRANALGQNTGHSWADAFNNLHTALQTAQPGDVIWVSEGIYHTADNGDRSAFFDVKSGLALYGGFSGVEANLAQRDWEAHPVILDGDIGVPGDSTDNTRNLVRMITPSAQTILDGFVLRNAVADDPDAPYQGLGASGAALYIDAGSGIAYPLIRHCRFERNSTIGNGGAAFIKSGTSGMVAPRFVDCRFERNRANAGGAVYRLGSTTLDTPDDFRDCYFYKNISNGYGSGIFYGDVNGRTDTLDVIHCIFDENEARSPITIPAGVFYTNGRSNGACLRFVGCRMRKNSSKSGSGIAYYSEDNPIKYFMVDSCLFDGNYTFQWNPSIAGLSIGMYSGYYDGVFKSYYAIRNSYIVNQDYGIIESSGLTQSKWFFENNIFQNNYNSNPYAGGGINIEGDSVFVRKNVIIDNNRSYCSITGAHFAACEGNIVYNGGLGVNSSEGADLIYNNIFDGANRTNAFGVVPKNIYVGNLFINNRYKIPLLPGYVPPAPQRWKMYNNIFINNHNTESGAAAQYYQYLPFYQDSVEFYNNSFDFPSCDVLGGKANCVSGNLFGQDLMLADTANRDYRLLPCSPAINAGINDPYALYNILKDYYDQPRILDGLADIGPIESPGLSLGAAPLIHAACPDSNSGSVDFVIQNGCEPLQYQWVHGNTSGTDLNGLEAGDYAFTITDQNGKAFALALNIPLIQPPVVTANIQSASCSTCANGAINLEVAGGGAFITYQWNTGATTQSIQSVSPGTYTVTISVSGGCSEVLTYMVPFTNAVGEIAHSAALQIRPNPANQQTQVNWPTTYAAETVTLYDCLGRSVLQVAVEAGASGCTIPTAKLPGGVYWCRVQGMNGLVQEGRIAVQH
ncbi:MAG: T9SS type A sorting domain-containing protein [Bacteroidota bacterium]